MSQPTDPRASGDATNGYDSECRTRAPILWESNAYNWFLEMFGTPQQSVDPALFQKFLQSLADHPPTVMSGSGFIGVVPFDYGYRGAIAGSDSSPVLGDWTQKPADSGTGWGRLPADQLVDR